MESETRGGRKGGSPQRAYTPVMITVVGQDSSLGYVSPVEFENRQAEPKPSHLPFHIEGVGTPAFP